VFVNVRHALLRLELDIHMHLTMSLLCSSSQAIVGLKKMDLIQAILSDKIQGRVAGGVGLLR